MFDFFKKKNKNTPTEKTVSKNESTPPKKNESQNDFDENFKIETEKFENDWSRKVKESDYVVIPELGKRKNGIIEDLIGDRGIRNFSPDENGKYNIESNSHLEEMLKIEESLINQFILKSNRLFHSKKSSPSFLNSNETSKTFSHFREKEFSRGREKLCLSEGYDFISQDKKIVSVQKNLYYLDWNKGIYFGFDNTIDTKWEDSDGRWEIYNSDYVTNQIFRLPKKLGDFTSENSGYQLIVIEEEMYELELFPKTWMNIDIFNSCFNLLISFDFRKNLIKRTGDFYKTILHQENLGKKEEKNKVQFKLSEFLKTIDSDGNKVVDITEENGFKILLDSYREELKEKDQKTIQNLVKLKLFIEDKGENLNKLFLLFEKIENENEMEHYVGVLNNEINIYQKFCFHSMSLITFLVEGDMFSFYEVYEVFDEINVFNSKWERDLSEKLDSIRDEIKITNSNLEKGFKELSDNIYSNTLQTQKSLEKLTYTTKESIKTLTQKMDLRLQSVKSSIDTNNLLTLINTYQVYKINKNTRTLKP